MPSQIISGILSTNTFDLSQPGVIVVVDPVTAEAMGAFHEVALSPEDAWEANSYQGVE